MDANYRGMGTACWLLTRAAGDMVSAPDRAASTRCARANHRSAKCFHSALGLVLSATFAILMQSLAYLRNSRPHPSSTQLPSGAKESDRAA
jgi:hypothetical protein